MEHSISCVAMASGCWNRGKEKVIGDKVVKEWRGRGRTAHRVPAGRQGGAGGAWEGDSPWARCQGRCLGRAGIAGSSWGSSKDPNAFEKGKGSQSSRSLADGI